MTPSGKSGFSKTQRYSFLVALFAIVLGLIFYGVFQYNLARQGKINENPSLDAGEELEQASATSSISFLNGLSVPAISASSCAAVMIDNAPEAEKQFGLNNASLIYEAPVEGGRTRFMAVYHLSASTEQFLGPVRSARPYFVDWAEELNCLYAHVGGSDAALEKISDSSIFDLNEFYNGGYFWRNKKYQAPHNTFTDVESLVKAFVEKMEKWKGRDVKSWLFAKTEGKELQAGEGFFEEKIGEEKVSWLFDQNLKMWKRSVNGLAHKDETGQIKAKNVVFQYVKAKVLDEEGRLFLQTVGRGQAVILKGSRVVKGTWEKDAATERTRFFGPDTKEIEFNQGAIWVEIVPEF